MRSAQKKLLKQLFLHALREIRPEALFRKYLHLVDQKLYYRDTLLDISSRGSLFLAGSGKASLSMAQAILPYLQLPIKDSLLITRSGESCSTFTCCPGDHPIPGLASLKAGQRMWDFLASLDEEDTLIYLLSGGSSAMMEVPSQGLDLSCLQEANRVFLSSGLAIQEINILRSQLSQMKGGKLAELCKARTYVLLLSDVIDNDFSVIGSGPFYPLKSSPETLQDLISGLSLKQNLPGRLLSALQKEQKNKNAEISTPPHYLLGSNMDLLEAAEAFLKKEGISVRSFPGALYGEASEVGKMIADMLLTDKNPRPSCLLFGGETSVTLQEKPGKGGRSQECALAVLSKLRDTRNYYFLSAGSDGIDGNTDAAGAIVSPNTYRKSQKFGLDPEKYLAKHDSYHFHRRCDSLLLTGPSGTNLADIAALFLC